MKIAKPCCEGTTRKIKNRSLQILSRKDDTQTKTYKAINRRKPQPLIDLFTSRRRLLLITTPSIIPTSCCLACRPTFMNEFFASAMQYEMKEYEDAIAPVKQRLFSTLLDNAQGHFLEIGIGTGPNLKYYNNQTHDNPTSTAARRITTLTGVDPNPYMKQYLYKNASQFWYNRNDNDSSSTLQWVQGTAESIPLPTNSQDAVICTLVLCSVESVEQSLLEVQRVLKPGGWFLWIEHTIAPPSKRWKRVSQVVLSPLQMVLADGCRLTRDPLPMINSGGFEIVEAERFEVEGMGLIGPHVAGLARLKV
jgi:ubiquinone/menaquinone biosynthesis C-methylase UbiE